MKRLSRVFLVATITVVGLTGARSADAGPDGNGGYLVESGDSLWGISRRLGVSLPSLLSANGLTVSSTIHPGQTLRIPTGATTPAPAPAPTNPTPAPTNPTPAPPSGGGTYTIRSGDSLYGIARRHGVTLANLLAANGLSVSSVIHPGQTLVIPSGATSPAPAPAPPAPAPAPTAPAPTAPAPTAPAPTTPAPTAPPVVAGRYTIVRGDSLYAISRRLGVSFASLLAANGLTANSIIHPGQTLIVPTGSGNPTAPPPAAGPSPVSSAEVERIIREVWPDELEQQALGIAYRESRMHPGVQNSCCVGLFQIYYDLHSWWLVDLGIDERRDLTDARTNARAALALYRRAGWTPWAATHRP